MSERLAIGLAPYRAALPETCISLLDPGFSIFEQASFAQAMHGFAHFCASRSSLESLKPTQEIGLAEVQKGLRQRL